MFINVLRDFYIVHYNILMVIAIMLALIVFFITKKNYKGIIIVAILMLALNAAMFIKTNGKAWTRTFYADDEYKEKYLFYSKIYQPEERETLAFSDSVEITFVAGDPEYSWVIYDEDETSHRIFHWCWLDDFMEEFASQDVADIAWGSNKAKAARKSSEQRVGDLDD